MYVCIYVFTYTGLAYNFFFYILFALGNFVLVFEEYYNTDGYCTTLRRCYSSFRRMVFDTAIGVIAGIIIIGTTHTLLYIHTYIHTLIKVYIQYIHTYICNT